MFQLFTRTSRFTRLINSRASFLHADRQVFVQEFSPAQCMADQGIYGSLHGIDKSLCIEPVMRCEFAAAAITKVTHGELLNGGMNQNPAIIDRQGAVLVGCCQ